MYNESYELMTAAAVKKVDFLKKNPTGYILLSIIAGAFIGLGVMIMSVTGAFASGTPYVKLAMGAVFASALSLVVMAGGELFTGNNMSVFAGFLRKKVPAGDMFRLWVVCFAGNWAGSLLIAGLFLAANIPSDAVGDFMVLSSLAKVSMGPAVLFARAVFCNIMVCLGVWCTFRCKSESGKLIMIFWCILIFVACGGEHTVANMTMLTVGLAKGGIAVSGYFYNILLAAIGNIVGGALCIALPYHLIGKEKNN